MRHKKIQTTKRHKKLKVTEGLSRHNVVKDKLLLRNKEQGIPNKLAEMMRLKTVIQKANAESSNKKNKNVKKEGLTKEKSEPIIEHGMTRMPTMIPDKVERKEFESDKSYLGRISKMVSKAINDANIEHHFDVDLHGSVKNDKAKQNSEKIPCEKSKESSSLNVKKANLKHKNK